MQKYLFLRAPLAAPVAALLLAATLLLLATVLLLVPAPSHAQVGKGGGRSSYPAMQVQVE